MVTSEELQQAFGYLFPDEVKALKQLAQSLPPNSFVVNIGAGSGTSGLALLESRDDLYLNTIDIMEGDNPFGSLYAERQVFERADVPGYRYSQTLGDSKEVGLQAQIRIDKNTLITGHLIYSVIGKKGPFADLVFIDGDHSYRGAKGDILAWLPNIKPGGIIAVHDYNKKEVYKRTDLPAKIPHPLPWPGVDRAVRKFLCPNYRVILHVDTLIAFEVK